MIYICNHCSDEIPELQTPGDTENRDFICKECSGDIRKLIERAKKIHLALKAHFERTP